MPKPTSTPYDNYVPVTPPVTGNPELEAYVIQELWRIAYQMANLNARITELEP
jgi:hypothetical protein